MEKQNIKKQNESYKTILIVLSALFFFISIPFILAILLNREIYKLHFRKIVNNHRNEFFSLIMMFFIIPFVIFGLSLFYILVKPTPDLNGILNVFLFLFSIAGLFFFIFFIIFLIFSKIYYFNLTRKRIRIEEEYKNNLQNKKISKSFFYKENLFFNHIFCVDIQDETNKEITKPKQQIEGTYLNDDCVIPDFALTRHISIIGHTGSGKTTTIKHFIKRAISTNKKVVFVDGKADKGLIDELTQLCVDQNKKIKVYELDNPENNIKYNPFKDKTPNQIVSMLVESTGYSLALKEEKDSSHYKRIEKAILDFIVPLMINYEKEKRIDFKLLEKWTNYDFVQETINNEDNWYKIFPELNKNDESFKEKAKIKIKELKANLNKLDEKVWDSLYIRYSSLVRSIKNIRMSGFSLQKELDKNNLDASDVILFSIPTMNDPTNSCYIANLIVQDIKQNASFNEKNTDNEHPALLFFDEFGSYGSTTITELLLQGRSKKYALFLLYQGIAELEKMQKGFSENVLNNTNSLIVHSIKEVEGAEKIASVFGTIKTVIDTKQTGKNELGKIDLTGTGTVKVGDEFVFNPNILKNELSVGCCVVRTIDHHLKPKIYNEIQKVNLI